ncbi:MAG: hypothetical protein EOO47_17705 [Flavobacterium sp.]|nr:MAG: hypothetical protein EOO47_17705 [Flavobacterium sp.]
MMASLNNITKKWCKNITDLIDKDENKKSTCLIDKNHSNTAISKWFKSNNLRQVSCAKNTFKNHFSSQKFIVSNNVLKVKLTPNKDFITTKFYINLKLYAMKEQSKLSVTDFLEFATNVNYFTKLKPNLKNHNLLKTDITITCYNELMQSIFSLLRTSITILKDEQSQTAIDAMLLLEIAVQLLPNDEMELLDELYKIL